MNQCFFTGRIGWMGKVESVGKDGKSKLEFSIALARRGGNKDDEPIWAKMIAWNGTAEFIEKYFNKGDGIEIFAHYEHRTFEGRDNDEVHVHEFIIDQVEFPKGGSRGDNKDNNRVNSGSKNQNNNRGSSGRSSGNSNNRDGKNAKQYEDFEDDDLGF